MKQILIVALAIASLALAVPAFARWHHGKPTAPSSCDGTINLGSGCTQPMLGVL